MGSVDRWVADRSDRTLEQPKVSAAIAWNPLVFKGVIACKERIGLCCPILDVPKVDSYGHSCRFWPDGQNPKPESIGTEADMAHIGCERGKAKVHSVRIWDVEQKTGTKVPGFCVTSQI